jgi:hypothetical protein
MKFKTFPKVAFSFFTLFAMNTISAQDRDQSTTAIVKSITMAKGVKGETKDPVNKTSVFQPTDTIHAVVRVDNAAPDTKLSAAWIAVDVGDVAEPNSEILTNDIIIDGTRNIDFILEPTNPLPIGSYEVEISVNDHLADSKKFRVKQ